MRSTIQILCLMTLAVAPAVASIIVYDGTPGIVAESNWQFLDSDGHVWRIENDGELHRQEAWDVSIPIQEIKFWTERRIVTHSNEFYWLNESTGDWVHIGTWPEDPASIDEEILGRGAASVSPNPSPGPCRIAFTMQSAGEVSVQIVDVSGRVIRHLLDGEHPAGDYDLVWDGKNATGRHVSAGCYYFQLMINDTKKTKSIVVTR